MYLCIYNNVLLGSIYRQRMCVDICTYMHIGLVDKISFIGIAF